MRCKEKEDFILANYQTMSYKEMSSLLGIKERTVQYYLTKNGLRKMERELTDSEIKFIKDNYKTMSYKEIAARLNVSERHVRGRINYMKMRKLRKFNSDYFHVIDSDIKAYFLGFIFADGWVIFNSSRRNYELGIELQSKDKYILERLNEELGGIHAIKHNDPYTSEINGVVTYHNHSDILRVYSKELVSDLISNGIVENKTQKDDYPKVSDALFFDFLRGYIDGDGCFANNKGNIYLSITCASIVPLEWIRTKLNSFNIISRTYKEKDRKYRLSCTDYESMKKLVNLMYHDGFSLCLSRKYNKISPLL